MANASGIEARSNHSREITGPLGEILGSEAWKNLTPNYSYIDHLLPQDIPQNQLENLINAFADGVLRIDYRNQGPRPKDIEGLGTLSFLGGGETKNGYLLTTASGQKMAVLYYRGNTNYNNKPFIPDDPRIRVSEQYPDKNNPEEKPMHKAEYSDFRTYLNIPLSFDGNKAGALILQEYGGSTYPKSLLTRTAEQKAKQRIIEYVTDRGYRISDSEFSARHYLDAGQKDGPPYVIDIYTDDFHRGDLQRYLHDRKVYHHDSLYSQSGDSEGVLATIRRKLGIKR